jgi:cell division protein FtsI (penicillin-binding protein 3)
VTGRRDGDGEDRDGDDRQPGWSRGRARRPAPAPGGSRGPDRPRASGRPAATDVRGPGRTGPSRGGTGRGGPAGGPGDGSPGRPGSGRAGGTRAPGAVRTRPVTGRPGPVGPGGTSRGGTSRDGASRDGASRDGASRDGASRAASRRDGTGRGRAGASAALRAPARARAILHRRNPRTRLNATMVVIAVILSVFAGRLVQMQGLDWSRYRTASAQALTKTLPIPTVRGSIVTSDGTVLALTVQTDDVAADPEQIPAAPSYRQRYAAALAGPLRLTPAAILALVNHPPGAEYVLLKKNISSSAAQAIDSLRIDHQALPGISMTPSYSRSYPNGDLAASLIGFTNVDGAGDLTGEAGLEQQYNAMLAGRDGSEEVETGTNGVPIPQTVTKVTPPVSARTLDLTISASIQYEAEQACRAEVVKARARNCSIVVMQPGTGKILAMAQYPTFNPSAPASYAATRNIAADNVFSPGSTLKPVTVAAALERGGQTPLSTYTVPSEIDVHGFEFHDAEPHPTTKYTIAGILANSLNDGMVQIVQHITPQVQYDYLRAFGLGAPSGLNLPGESAGLLPRPGSSTYYRDDPYELSFGQGVSVTAIQAASIYATIANGGVRVQPSLVAGTRTAAGQFIPAPAPPRRRVITARTASQLMTMLQQVPGVDEQQGEPWGLIAGYPVASKTGTAQVSDSALSKCLCQYGSSYIGIAPAQNPQLVVAVNVQDPTRQGFYGDEIAGPVFYSVMKFALTSLKIPPTGAKPPYIRLTAP